MLRYFTIYKNLVLSPEQVEQNKQDHLNFLRKIQLANEYENKKAQLRELVVEGTKSTIVDYDEYKLKVLSILNEHGKYPKYTFPFPSFCLYCGIQM